MVRNLACSWLLKSSHGDHPYFPVSGEKVLHVVLSRRQTEFTEVELGWQIYAGSPRQWTTTQSFLNSHHHHHHPHHLLPIHSASILTCTSHFNFIIYLLTLFQVYDGVSIPRNHGRKVLKDINPPQNDMVYFYHFFAVVGSVHWNSL